jgi:hypothetical protein
MNALPHFHQIMTARHFTAMPAYNFYCRLESFDYVIKLYLLILFESHIFHIIE